LDFDSESRLQLLLELLALKHYEDKVVIVVEDERSSEHSELTPKQVDIIVNFPRQTQHLVVVLIELFLTKFSVFKCLNCQLLSLLDKLQNTDDV